MKIQLICVGRTRRDGIGDAYEDYMRRAAHYFPVEQTIIPDVKTGKAATAERQKEAEGELILAAVSKGDCVVLMDERGKEFTSRGFAEFIEQKAVSLAGKLVFVIGGPFGFSRAVYDRADRMMSLSQMTLPHDLARLFFAEQLYRAGTILRGEQYHHD